MKAKVAAMTPHAPAVVELAERIVHLPGWHDSDPVSAEIERGIGPLLRVLEEIGGSDSCWNFDRDSHFEDCPISDGCPDHQRDDVNWEDVDHEDETDCHDCLKNCDCTLGPIFRNAATARAELARWTAPKETKNEKNTP